MGPLIQIKPKPADVFWTDSQWEAISAEGTNLLVSAAAGSGKTAVLVERIIRKLSDESNPKDVDKLLIVTFTNAAAAEMKSRIGEALQNEIKKTPSSLHLRRQLSLLNRAQISTLHSFCMSVIRKYYYLVEVDPQFRIMDQTEGELLREEILDEVLETYYQEGSSRFLSAADRFNNDRSDEGLRGIIRKLFHFSRSHPDPESWLENMSQLYSLKSDVELENTRWGQELWRDAKLRITMALQHIEEGKLLSQEEGGPTAYLDNLTDDEFQITPLKEADSWNELQEHLASLTFKRLKSIKKDSGVNEQLKDQVQRLRKQMKEEMTNLAKEAFAHPPSAYIKDIQTMKEPVQVIKEITVQFSETYQQKKKEAGLVDFSDLEHICLNILIDENGSPSTVAKEYQRQLHELLIDEYQDTNHAQEAIIQAVSKGNNLFLVGDVKQSVYRFRLAEPDLFLKKYKEYNRGDGFPGYRIDLGQNFRSRREVLDSTNFIFRQIMSERAGDIDYDELAELKLGNLQYPQHEQSETELILINKGSPISSNLESAESDTEEELETAQLEARWMARRIKQMIKDKYPIVDKETGQMRTVTFRDIVILMRSMPWAPVIMDECKKEGLPVHADLSGGYFEAVEISIVLSLLKIIDNPRQDIPLASVLRSPIVQMNEEELANVRAQEKNGTFFDAFYQTVTAGPESVWREKAANFYEKLHNWRSRSKNQALSELIWDLLQETGYYDFVGGLPAGKQRQANLLALYDRARSYEKTSFRGLFRFLRFIERMQDRGDDLGTARALGEQEDVIRMMTIHKSKGLEFPIVFLAGMNKPFNFRDLYSHVLLHKELGIGTKFVDPEKRLVRESLPQLAVKKRLHRESVAEEMRVLYVGMTRAKEKLYLVGTVPEAEKSIQQWEQHRHSKEWLLPEAGRLRARSFLDWVGPAVFRHQTSESLIPFASANATVFNDPSTWNIQITEKEELLETEAVFAEIDQEKEEAIKNFVPVSVESEWKDEVAERLQWKYAFDNATRTRSKQTVSEWKRAVEDEYSEKAFQASFRSKYADRPKFLVNKTQNPAEMGTAVHTVLEHISLQTRVTATFAASEIGRMIALELLTESEASAVDPEAIVRFFESELGMAMLESSTVYREIPFSYKRMDTSLSDEDIVLIQGAVDCLFEDQEKGLVLVDFKTDSVLSRFDGDTSKAKQLLKSRYQNQIDIYREAIASIWNRPVEQAYIYAFEGNFTITM
ncbi:helicase-exonuclease AddAB subunit AddA [Alteribacillus sp. HJP-4]|uniref:helicase-exonuclease AddAB subunit AddA n=1 Tax=Alteribacillus sp. HJP-4 TaxID=2775394 RepID=UPI0035CD2B45